MLRFQKACQLCKQPLAPMLWSQVARCGVVEQALFWVPERPGCESQLGILLWVCGQSLCPVPLSVVLREDHKPQGIYVPPALNPTPPWSH